MNKMALSSSVLSAKVKHEQEGRSSEGPVTGQEMETQVLTLKSCNIARRLLTHVLVPKWLLPFLECFPQVDIEQESLLFVSTFWLGALKIYTLSWQETDILLPKNGKFPSLAYPYGSKVVE